MLPLEYLRFQSCNPIITENGKALDTLSAAHCILDYARTTQYVRGLYKAITDKLKNKSKSPVHILYIGTGPYAVLMLPITEIFNSDQVKFTLIEVHPLSCEYLNRTIQSLNLSDYVNKIEMQDATKLKLSDYDSFDICIVETMNAALKKEPQVAITYHISNQMEAETIFIPQKIQIYAGLSNDSIDYLNMSDGENQKPRTVHKLCKIMELVPSKRSSINTIFPKIKVEIPESLIKNYPLLSLYTDIDVYDEFRLMSGFSAITFPQLVLNYIQNPELPKEIYFQYKEGKEPGFIYELNS